MRKVKTGIIGLGQRGYGLLSPILAIDEAEVVALCDVYEDRRIRARDLVREKRGESADPVLYEDYRDLLKDKNVEAVLIATSWDEHTRMAVDSMRAGKYTALEVSGAYDIEDCWQLVRTYEETKTPIMFMENCCFDRFELLCTSLARAGKFGKIMYCHGAYAHELRDEILGGNVNRHYRLVNYMHRNCENYPTHELGPIAKILGINRGNKMLTVSAVATDSVGLELATDSSLNPDPSLKGAKFKQGDIVLTTIKCAGGEVISIRLDTTLPRGYSREFTVRGTKGLAVQDANLVRFESDGSMHDLWDAAAITKKYIDTAENYKDYLPDIWKNITEEELQLGHGGMDYLEFKTFFNAVINGKEMPIDIYDAAAWMAITPL
ncbi:MAG: Gfo/Idh/MocA family oxidoreductase, partial [Clostridia bacterium]|nr:Gfo/Idh/MocA family oxidoreductase [Clostridia bacterium]